MEREAIPIAILGASGSVGQKAIRLACADPRFKICELSASSKRVGEPFGKTSLWHEDAPLSPRVASLPLLDPSAISAPFVLSALPAPAAREIEPLLTARGLHVASNASAFRMQALVPLLIPEVNASHLTLVEQQSSDGKIVANPNCVVAIVAPALYALQALGAIAHVGVVTLQAISGAGYGGLSASDIFGNVIPHIEGEEAKIEEEIRKILGSTDAQGSFSVTAQVHRVPVMHGHVAALQVEFEKAVEVEEVAAQFERSPALFCLHTGVTEPQPARDLSATEMRIHIGQIKKTGSPRKIKLVAMGHNLVRGAAGAALANLEALSTFLKERQLVEAP